MKINKIINQLNESVKRRQGVFRDKPIELTSPDFPIKGITPEMIQDYRKTFLDVNRKIGDLPLHKQVATKEYQRIYRHPFYKKAINPDTGRVYRGRIKGSTPIRYTFRPEKMSGGRRGGWVGAKYTEAGTHMYDFTTSLNKKGSVYITHGETSPAQKRKGLRTKSYIGFDIDGSWEKVEPTTKENMAHGVSVFRTVLPAIRHHIRSLNPDQITFKSFSEPFEQPEITPLQKGVEGERRNTRKNLYTFLSKKLNKTHDVKIKTTRGGSISYTLTRKKKDPNSLQNAIRILNAERSKIQRRLSSKKQIKENNEKFSDLNQDEWDKEFDTRMDRGGESAEEITRSLGKRPPEPPHFWKLSPKERFTYIRTNILNKKNSPKT